MCGACRVFDLYFRRAWKFGLAITHREIDADDLAAEAIAHGLDVVRDPSRRPAKFTGWLLGVVKHLAWRRGGRRNQPLPVELKMEDTRHGRPSGAVIESEMAGVLSRAMAALTADERDLVEERCIRGTSRQDLARRLQCSIDTIDRRVKL